MSKFRILVADAISPRALHIFEDAEGFTAETKTGLSEAELVDIVPDYHGLIVRSATTVTQKVIDGGSQLKVIGRAGSGIDNIDLRAATRRGIVVMNTPGGNTISTAEHTMGMILSLCRNIPQAYASLKSKSWERKSFQGMELRGKTLGIIGVGHVGKAVARMARGFGMRVIGSDPFITDELAARHKIHLVEMDGIWKESDWISCHSPLTKDTRHLLNTQNLAKCKQGVRVVNCARGGIVDEKALWAAIEDGKVAGAALDVFEEEPPDFGSPLLSSQKVIFTPHLGASTREAQETVAVLVAGQMVDALQEKGIRNAVNMPSIEMEEWEALKSFMLLGRTLGSLQYQMAKGQMKELLITLKGNFGNLRTELISTSIVQGLLGNTAEVPVNEVNAMALAAARGLKIVESQTEASGNYLQLVSTGYVTSEGRHEAEGSVFGKSDVRIVSVDGFRLNAVAEGFTLVYTNDDRPGMIAQVSSVLARNDVNIASMFLSREKRGGIAMVLVNVDARPSPELLAEIRSLDGIHDVKSMELA